MTKRGESHYKEELWIQMEYMQRGDLHKLIQKQKADNEYFSEELILSYFTQLCLAIKDIHSKKIIHRDIKTMNVFIGENETIKLGDFGVSKQIEETMQINNTMAGTPSYMAPEIYKGQYKTSVDIWALGVLLYELCELDMPIRGSNIHALQFKIVSCPRIKEISSQYSLDLRNLVKSLLQYDPDMRLTIDEILRLPIIVKTLENLLSTHP